MANYKAFMIIASLVALIFLFSLWKSSFEEHVRNTKRKLYWATTILIAVIVYSFQSVSQLIDKMMQYGKKPSVPRPSLQIRQKLQFLRKSPAPWNLAILIVAHITLAIYQKHIREYYFSM